MVDEQGSVSTLDPVQVTLAVDQEVQRLVRVTEDHLSSSGYRAWAYRIIRKVVPDMTRARWRDIAGRSPDASLVEEEWARPEAEAAARLLRQHGRPLCCDSCNLENADQLRRELGLPAWEPGDREPEPERTCRCGGCADDHCQGDCDPCEDHGCEQCYPGHTVYSCCGYCEDCDHHVDNDLREEVCNMGHCHECDHQCR